MFEKILLGEYRKNMAVQGINKNESKLNEKGVSLYFHIHKFWVWQLILGVGMVHLIRILTEQVLESLVYD